MKSFKVYLLLLLVLLMIIYLPLFKGFFQHDEWYLFGDIFSKSTNAKDIFISFFAPNKDHYVPLYQLIVYLYTKFFKFHFEIYVFLSIFLHLLNVLLVFFLGRKIFKENFPAILSATLFGLSASSHQATSWVLVNVITQYSTLFALISLILFWVFLEEKKSHKLILSTVFLVTSLMFKEIAVGFFVLYPMAIVLFSGFNLKKQIKYFLSLFITGFGYLTLRVSMYFIPGAYASQPTVFKMQSLGNIILNIITFPSKVLLQTIFPPRFSLIVSKWLTFILPRNLTGFPTTTQFDIFVEQKTLQFFSFTFFIFTIFCVYWLWKQKKNQVLVKLAIFGLLFTIINSLVYAFSPGRVNLISLVDSRNLYLPLVGTAIFTVSVVTIWAKKKKWKIATIILSLVFLQALALGGEIKRIAGQGNVRREILFQIKSDYPKLPPKVVFYTKSDSSYYGMPETDKIFPFEVNFGYTTLIWYQPTEQFPKEFLKQNGFLYGLTKEGYQEIDGRGFGYFHNWDLFVQAIRDNNLDKDSIIAFSYKFGDESVEDITLQTREEINDINIKVK